MCLKYPFLSCRRQTYSTLYASKRVKNFNFYLQFRMYLKKECVGTTTTTIFGWNFTPRQSTECLLEEEEGYHAARRAIFHYIKPKLYATFSFLMHGGGG